MYLPRQLTRSLSFCIKVDGLTIVRSWRQDDCSYMVLLRPRLLPQDFFDNGNEERQGFATSSDRLKLGEQPSTRILVGGRPHLNNDILVPHEKWDAARLDGSHAMEAHARSGREYPLG